MFTYIICRYMYRTSWFNKIVSYLYYNYLMSQKG